MGGEPGNAASGARPHARGKLLWVLAGVAASDAAGAASGGHEPGKPALDWRGCGLHRKQKGGRLGSWRGVNRSEDGFLGTGIIDSGGMATELSVQTRILLGVAGPEA